MFKKSKTAFFVQMTVKVTCAYFVLLNLALNGSDQPRQIHSSQQKKKMCGPFDYYDDEEEKALRSKSAARPGEMTPLVTLSSKRGRASLTLG